MSDSRESTVPVCRRCKQEAVRVPPRTWRAVLTPRPGWSHTDGTPLCPIPSPNRPGAWGPYASEPVWRPASERKQSA